MESLTSKINRAVKEQKSFIGEFEPIPYWLIEKIEVNEQMRTNCRDRRILKWLDEDYIFTHCAYFALAAKTPNSRKRLQTYSMNRGVVYSMAQPFFDEYGTALGIVSGKGNGLTERALRIRFNFYSLPTHLGPEMARQAMTEWIENQSITEPQGFYGHRNADIEQSTTNAFAEIGGRPSRVLGKITLHTDKFRYWLSKNGVNSPYASAESLDIVTRNGDKPSILIRALGGDRVEDFYYSNMNGVGIYNTQRILMRNALLFLNEIRGLQTLDFSHLPTFKERYHLTSQEVDKHTQYLIQIIQGDFSEKSTHSFLWLQAYLNGWNVGKFTQLVKSYPTFTPPETTLQNKDLVAIWSDWEDSDRQLYYQPFNPTDYSAEILNGTRFELSKLKNIGLINRPEDGKKLYEEGLEAGRVNALAA